MAKSDNNKTPLDTLITILSEQLEDKPDPWFNKPQGWLSKPDYKRQAQSRGSIIEQKPPNFFDKLVGSPYNRRWFVLDIKRKRLTYYKDEEHLGAGLDSGEVDMSKIVQVIYSKVYDAPEFSLDLVGLEQHYTVVADSHAQMVRWACAFNIVIRGGQTSRTGAAPTSSSSSSNREKTTTQQVELGKDKWQRYDYTYTEAGPLRLNVMGSCIRNKSGHVLNNWIKVTSFEADPATGRPGRSETSGLISVNDYIVGVNGTDLTTFSFNDAMDVIGQAGWPKTLHFLRDRAAVLVANRVEGWVMVNYPALNRIRRRYAEFRNEAIHFRKPAPGGAAQNARDAYFWINQVQALRPIHDKTLPAEQQFVLWLVCKPGSVVELVDENDQPIGGTSVETLELYFPNETQMNAWRSCIVSPTTDLSNAAAASVVATPTIEVMVKEVIELGSTASPCSKGMGGMKGGTGAATCTTDGREIVAVKSGLTGRFSSRVVVIEQGHIKWNKVDAAAIMSGGTKGWRSLFLLNSVSCELRSMRAVDDPYEAQKTEGGYRYQLTLTTSQQTLVLGMTDEGVLSSWMKRVQEMIALSPLGGSVVTSGVIEKASSSSSSSASAASTAGGAAAMDEDGDFIDAGMSNLNINLADNADTSDSVRGYLYKRSDKPGSKDFHRRYFVLQELHFRAYKSAAEANAPNSETLALAYIDLRGALEVRDCMDPTAPENSFEVVMSSGGSAHVFAAEDEADCQMWVEAISDVLDVRQSVVRHVGGGAGGSQKSTGRVQALKDAAIHSGRLQMKRLNRLSQTTTWRDRFIVIVVGTIYYYETENDYYDEDKDPTGEIPCVAIMRVETSLDPKLPKGCGFDVTALVQTGGDANGERVYTFEAYSVAQAKEWMEKICTATGTLALKVKPGDAGFESAINDQQLAQRQNQKLRNVFQFAASSGGGGGGGSALLASPSGGGSGGGVAAGGSGANKGNPLLQRRISVGGGRGAGAAGAAARRRSVEQANAANTSATATESMAMMGSEQSSTAEMTNATTAADTMSPSGMDSNMPMMKDDTAADSMATSSIAAADSMSADSMTTEETTHDMKMGITAAEVMGEGEGEGEGGGEGLTQEARMRGMSLFGKPADSDNMVMMGESGSLVQDPLDGDASGGRPRSYHNNSVFVNRGVLGAGRGSGLRVTAKHQQETAYSAPGNI